MLVPYVRPLIWAFGFQFLLIAFYWTALDFGQHRRASAYASMVFWLGVLLILIRRREKPTSADLAFIRWALLPVGVLATESILFVWRMRGQ